MREWNLNMSKFYWNEDTIKYFDFMACYLNKEQVKEAITNFVEDDCITEDDETEEELVTDLMNKVYE